MKKNTSLIWLIRFSYPITYILFPPRFLIDVSNSICEKPNYLIPLNTLSTAKPVLPVAFSLSIHTKYNISIAQSKNREAILDSFFSYSTTNGYICYLCMFLQRLIYKCSEQFYLQEPQTQNTSNVLQVNG